MAKKYIELEAAIIGLAASSLTPHQIDDAAEALQLVPAADVVEVVRCRECRFAPSGTDDSVEQGFGLEWPDDNWPYHTNPCPYRCEDGYYSHKPKPDFFCAAGQRKDGGQDE